MKKTYDESHFFSAYPCLSQMASAAMQKVPLRTRETEHEKTKPGKHKQSKTLKEMRTVIEAVGTVIAWTLKIFITIILMAIASTDV